MLWAMIDQKAISAKIDNYLFKEMSELLKNKCEKRNRFINEAIREEMIIRKAIDKLVDAETQEAYDKVEKKLLEDLIPWWLRNRFKI